MSNVAPRRPGKEDPVPVEITEDQTPIPVTIEGDEPEYYTDETGRKSLAPTTTVQEDIVSAGQRRINVIWEVTQAIIAVAITLAVIYTATAAVSSETLTNAFFLIVGFYFSRTNHTNVGGVGRKITQQPYTGR